MLNTNIINKKVGRVLNKPNKTDLLLCCLLMASFCYELPVVELTSFDRLNPRLFDIVLVVAFIKTRWCRNNENKVVIFWEYLTITFILASVVSFLVLVPKQYGYFSLFFGAKYLEGLIAIWILTGFDWNIAQLDKLFKAFCYGLIFAGVYGLLQLVDILPSERFLPTGVQIITQRNIVLATFGPTYFHSGVVGAIGAGIALTLRLRSSVSNTFFLLSFLAGLFLAFFSGSRTALGLVIVIVFIILAIKKKYLFVGLLVTFLLFANGTVNKLLYEESVTFQRLSINSGQSSYDARLGKNYIDDFSNYWHEFGFQLLAIGGGFYVVPMHGKYRVGYGSHNIHFFPLEQAGLLGFFAAILFWFTVFKQSFKRRNGYHGRCALGIVIGLACMGWVGQIFYFGFGTENMVVFQVSTLALLLSNPIEQGKYSSGG